MEVRLHWLGWTRKDVTGDVLELGLLEGIGNHQADEEKEKFPEREKCMGHSDSIGLGDMRERKVWRFIKRRKYWCFLEPPRWWQNTVLIVYLPPNNFLGTLKSHKTQMIAGTNKQRIWFIRGSDEQSGWLLWTSSEQDFLGIGSPAFTFSSIGQPRFVHYDENRGSLTGASSTSCLVLPSRSRNTSPTPNPSLSYSVGSMGKGTFSACG